MSFIRYLIALLSMVLFTLSGCATAPMVDTVVDTKQEVIETPKELLKKAPVSPPPGREEYLPATPEERQALLTQYSRRLLKELASCQVQLSNISELQTQKQNLIKKDQ